MASLWILPLFIIFTCLPMSSISSSSNKEAPKVKLGLYYETLCPFCSRFIVNNLSFIFEDELINIIDLKLVPYGNARVSPNNLITCQHGDLECFLNTVEACAMNVWPDTEKHFTFIQCVEKLVMEGKAKEFESCFVKGLDKEPVYQCYISGLGKKLELQHGKETDALKPPHEYVPWVTVDGKPLRDDYDEFKKYVCNAYKGTLPKACQSTDQLETVSKPRSTQMAQVCYAKEETSPKTNIWPSRYLLGGAK